MSRGPAAASVAARWILPISRPPIEHGWIEVVRGRIARVAAGPPPPGATDLGDVAILPGLVNAHTHLELSWLAGRIPAAASIVDWIRAVITARSAGPGETTQRAAMERAVAGMVATGTVLVADISNTLASVPAIRSAGLGGVVFHELLGFSTTDAATTVREAWRRATEAIDTSPGPEAGTTCAAALDVSVVAHAPYSVAPALFAELARRRRGDAPLSVHVAESIEEIEFLRTGQGPFRRLLEDLGVWDDYWSPPGCDPIEYLQALGYLQAGLLAVHAVHVGDQALTRLREAGAVVVTCPRSNEWVGGGLPHVSAFYSAGVPVAIGTDSLASAPSLNLFDELAQLRRIAPDVSAASLLESATRVGARALGFGRMLGTLATGKCARLVSVGVPGDVTDVEEYLVSGVPAEAVRPLTFPA